MNLTTLSRRAFIHRGLGAVSAAVAFPGILAKQTFAAGTKPSRPVPLILQTDLFRPFNDPDDHFDLACVYALAQRGAVDLLGVLCDSPPPWVKGDPDRALRELLSPMG